MPGGTFGALTGASAADPLVPTVTIEIAVDAGAYTDPDSLDWEDVSDRVAAFNWTAGRTSELDQIAAGAGSVTFDNTDRAFDFDHAASPYAGKLTPNRQIRATATWGSTSYPIFRGYIDEFGPLDNDQHEHAELQVSVSDAFKFLAYKKLTPARPWTIGHPVLGKLDDETIVLGGNPEYPAERSGVRIAKILKYIGWPAALMDIDAGRTVLRSDMPDPATFVLDYLQRIVRTELGTLFVSPAGVITFREQRAWTRIATQRTSQALFSDSAEGTGLNYSAIQVLPPSAGRVKNVVTRGDETNTATASDVTSIDAYGPVEDSMTDLLAQSPVEYADHADQVLQANKTPAARVQSLLICPEQDIDNLWDQALGRWLGDWITVERTPTYGDSVASYDVRVEQVNHDVVAADLAWRTTWALSPVDPRKIWTVGDPVLGKLDDPTIILGY
jgi:hypothetical protein